MLTQRIIWHLNLSSPIFFSTWLHHVTSLTLLNQQSSINLTSFYDSTIFWVIWHSTWRLPFTLSIFPPLPPSSCYWVELIIILKSSKPNRSASPFKKRSSYLLIKAMAGPYACRNLYQNFPLGGENELTKSTPRAPTESSNIYTPTPATLRAPNPAPAPAPPFNNELFQ